MRRLLAWATLASSAALAQSWQPLGPEGGDVTALLVDTRTAGRVYAATRGGALFRSDDGAGSWTFAALGLNTDLVFVLAADPDSARGLFAATNNGLFKTDDDGASWHEVPTGLTGPGKSLAALATERGRLWASSNVSTNGVPPQVLRGLDGGTAWTPFALPMAGATVSTLAVDPNAPGVVYAGTSCCGGGVLKTTNGGQTWEDLSDGLLTRLIDTVAVDPASSQRLYAMTALGLQLSVDGGAWTAVAGGLPGRRGVFAISPANPSALIAGLGTEVYRSTDSAQTWSSAGTGLSPRSITTVALDGVQSSYAGTFGDGVYVSRGTGDWAPANHGLRGTWVRSVASGPGHLWVGTYASGAAHSTDLGATWAFVDAGSRIEALVMDPANASTLYAVADGQLKRSTNGGADWSVQQSGLDAGVTSVVLAPSQPQRLFAVACGNTAYRSDDGAQSWQPTGALAEGRCVRNVAVDPTDSSFVLLSAGGGWANDAVLISTNAGADWTLATGLPAMTIPGPVAIDPGSPRTLYVGLSGGVGGLWRSRDDGVSWTAVRPSVGDVFGVVVNPETHAVYCVAAAGVSKSADQGATWESYTFDLLSVFQCRLAVGTAPHELYLGSYGLGLLALGGGLVSSPDGGALDGGAPGPGESIVVGTCGCSEGPHAGVLFSVAAVALLALRRRRQFS